MTPLMMRHHQPEDEQRVRGRWRGFNSSSVALETRPDSKNLWLFNKLVCSLLLPEIGRLCSGKGFTAGYH